MTLKTVEDYVERKLRFDRLIKPFQGVVSLRVHFT